MIPILADLSAHAWKDIAEGLGLILFFIIALIWALNNAGKDLNK
jgi:hypothetical protein